MMQELLRAPILKDTGCRIGQHVWTWTGYQNVTEPDNEQLCRCGLYTWEYYHYGIKPLWTVQR